MGYKNIVVSGDIGTGTTTLARSLAKKLGWRYLSAGDFFRAYHKKHNIPIWNKAAIPDKIERGVDYEFLDKMKEEFNIVFDTHYAGWFSRNLKNVFKILLICDSKVATQRILAREHTHKETPREIEERRVQLRAKFKKLYGDDNYEYPKYFHLVLDTTSVGTNQTLSAALKSIITS